jgi:hypothetical protein
VRHPPARSRGTGHRRRVIPLRLLLATALLLAGGLPARAENRELAHQDGEFVFLAVLMAVFVVWGFPPGHHPLWLQGGPGEGPVVRPGPSPLTGAAPGLPARPDGLLVRLGAFSLWLVMPDEVMHLGPTRPIVLVAGEPLPARIQLSHRSCLCRAIRREPRRTCPVLPSDPRCGHYRFPCRQPSVRTAGGVVDVAGRLPSRRPLAGTARGRSRMPKAPCSGGSRRRSALDDSEHHGTRIVYRISLPTP